jgi:site-specific DNA-methyltransferase (adenine-specific)
VELDIIKHGDCLELLRELPESSVDLICTDPPYGLTFMGKDWDKAVPPTSVWEECLRVLKPGAFAFIMSAVRQDVLARMITKLSDAGFEISTSSIYWVYATGFPKAMNISRAIDDRAGVEQPVVGAKAGPGGRCRTLEPSGGQDRDGLHGGGIRKREEWVTEPVTEDAKRLKGAYAGYQAKPAVEIILVAMKPLSEPTYIDQALANGKGVTWLDDGRIPYGEGEEPGVGGRHNIDGRRIGAGSEQYGFQSLDAPVVNTDGRFAPNLLVEDDVLDDGTIRKSDGGRTTRGKESKVAEWGYEEFHMQGYGDQGGYSMYFSLDRWWEKHGWAQLPEEVQRTFPFLNVPKPTRAEKEKGLEGFEEKKCRGDYDDSSQFGLLEKIQNSPRPTAKNTAPTVKPIKLMSYLITIGSRQGDVILDPYVGSGTTCIAAKRLSRRYIGFELEEEYFRIAQARLKAESSAMDWF